MVGALSCAPVVGSQEVTTPLWKVAGAQARPSKATRLQQGVHAHGFDPLTLDSSSLSLLFDKIYARPDESFFRELNGILSSRDSRASANLT